MKVFIDTEFYEFQPHEHLWNEEGPLLLGANAVQLISIGAVREDGAEFYAENADFNWSTVPKDHWLQEHVRPHLFTGGALTTRAGDRENADGGYFPAVDLAAEFRQFAIGGEPAVNVPVTEGVVADLTYNPPEFWGYFCDYDWVVLCGLYGRMKDLPPEFPMFCMDIKQLMEHLGVGRDNLPKQEDTAHHALADARWNKQVFDYIDDHFNHDLPGWVNL